MPEKGIFPKTGRGNKSNGGGAPPTVAEKHSRTGRQSKEVTTHSKGASGEPTRGLRILQRDHQGRPCIRTEFYFTTPIIVKNMAIAAGGRGDFSGEAGGKAQRGGQQFWAKIS